jgi:Secretion system C-terminal sorting domain
MKKLLLISTLMLIGYAKVHAQQSTVAAGGEASGSGGTMSYSAGQVLYTTNFGSNGSAIQGVQQTAVNPILTNVQTSQCGITLSAINLSIYANNVAIATGYRFKVTKVIASIPSTNPIDIQTIDKPTRSFKITDLALFAYNTTYQIEVAIKIGAVWQPFYGAPCNVTTPNALTQVRAIQCNTTLTNMTDDVFADNVNYVAGYRFKITHSVTLVSQTYDNPLRVYKMTYLNSPAIDYGTTYKVEVALKNYDGSYSAYGPICNVTTPNFPTTQIQLTQCGITPTNGSQNIFANLISAASMYRFRITNASLPYSSTVDNPLRAFYLNQFVGLLPNTTYNVDVSVKIGSIFGPYGSVCTITTPAVFRSLDINSPNDFAVFAYPNPFEDNVKFEIKTILQSPIQIKVYDMLGKLIEDKTVSVSEIANYEVGEKYPSGVYNVIVAQGEYLESVRVIKR